MGGSNTDVASPGGLAMPAAGIMPGDLRRFEYGTSIQPSIVPPGPDWILEAGPLRGLVRAIGPDTASDANAWHGMSASVEHDASSEDR